MIEVRNISEQGIALIKKFEGFSAQPYICPAGKRTVGYGHVIHSIPSPEEITEATATQILLDDLQPVMLAVNRLVKVRLTQPQFDALCSLVFNIGVSAFIKSTLLKRLNAGDKKASQEFLRWVFAGEKILAGLQERRMTEQRLFEGGAR